MPRVGERPQALTRELLDLYGRLPQPSYPKPPKALAVTLGPAVHDAWQGYSKAVSHELLTADLDDHLWGTYGRLPTYALKVAIILAALDWPTEAKAPTIQMVHLARALSIAESWRASAHRALEMARETQFIALKDRVYRQIADAHPGGITKRDLGRAMTRESVSDIEQALGELVSMGEIEAAPSGGARGPRSVVYVLPQE